MWLFQEAIRLLSKKGFTKIDLNDQQGLQEIPFSSAIRLVKKD